MASMPQYQKIRDYLAERILSGVYASHSQIPPEEDLARQFGVSRMTANKAIMGLVREGYLARRRGAGTFVTDLKSESTLIEVRNIADEVHARNHRYSNKVLVREALQSDAKVADLMAVKTGSRVLHTVLVHYENDVAIQLEDRYVNSQRVPNYLTTDFAQHTPNDVLVKAAPISHLEHTVEAVLSGQKVADWLAIKPSMPCLRMTRRTWSGKDLITYAELTFPGDRYKLRAAS